MAELPRHHAHSAKRVLAVHPRVLLMLVVILLLRPTALVLAHELAHDVPELIGHQLLMQVIDHGLRHAIEQAGFEQGREVDEGDRGAFLVQEFGLRWVELHILVAGGNNAIETNQFEALALHLNHIAAEVEDQVVAEAVGDFHATLVCVALGRREDDVHLLVGEVVLEELLVLKAICGAGDHADLYGLEKHLHSHY